MALEEPRDRRVIRTLLGRQHPEGDVLLAGALDRARGPDPARVRVQQQADHHRRVIRRPAAPIDPIGAIERLQIDLGNSVDHKPGEVPRRQPLAHVRRHQKRLVAITRNKALADPEIVLNPPDDTPDIRDSHRRKQQRRRSYAARRREYRDAWKAESVSARSFHVSSAGGRRVPCVAAVERWGVAIRRRPDRGLRHGASACRRAAGIYHS